MSSVGSNLTNAQPFSLTPGNGLDKEQPALSRQVNKRKQIRPPHGDGLLRLIPAAAVR
jgi:hypothetical protein